MASQRDVKNRIGSVKNIQKITRAMEMVAAARLRRAEQRIAALRPYADALRRMTRQAALDAGAEASRLELLNERETVSTVGLLLVTGDRGLAGGFNSQVIRAGVRAGTELDEQGLGTVWYATGRRGVSSLTFRGREVSGAYMGFTDKPSYADARDIAGELIEAYTTGTVDRVELVYNAYVSPLTQEVTHETLLPLSSATIAGEEEREGAGEAGGETARGAGTAGSAGTVGATGMGAGSGSRKPGPRALVEYEPDAEEILRRLVPDYVETSIYRALVESAAGFFGAQMTAMRNASENAGEIITDLTLEMNRARQAEITQEIMEVVAGAEGLS
ncbi:MAG TPA: ATP synthase F1 subunit gamma [Solirubrobacteraceae bacterium]|jgi:F-type H+-transporting ATPase subunit gamma|nr:ATP synthase F1 subunit gamma [Solirubrobacteraceae bacterium]